MLSLSFLKNPWIKTINCKSDVHNIDPSIKPINWFVFPIYIEWCASHFIFYLAKRYPENSWAII